MIKKHHKELLSPKELLTYDIGLRCNTEGWEVFQHEANKQSN
jgi:hypothetical protein